MKKIINKLIPILLAFALMFVLGAGISAETVQQTDVIEISSVEELMAINQNLSGHYVLTVDIDLAGQEWMPIGTYAPSGESEEEQEIPSADYAFTGIFDGQGHTLPGLFIKMWDPMTKKIFGPNNGFTNVFYPKQKGEYRMDVTSCPYCRCFTELGCPELTRIFCENDERIYGNLPGLKFERTGTLGKGAKCCDFLMKKV